MAQDDVTGPEKATEKPWLWTSETAKQMAAKAAEARAAKSQARRDNPVQVIKDALPSLFADLLKAARGEAPYHDLLPEKRLAALTKALEYGAGRPVPIDKTSPSEPEPDEDGREKPGSLVIE